MIQLKISNQYWRSLKSVFFLILKVNIKNDQSSIKNYLQSKLNVIAHRLHNNNYGIKIWYCDLITLYAISIDIKSRYLSRLKLIVANGHA